MAMSVVYTTINGRLIQQVKGGQVTKFVSDTLGSVVAEVDDSGQITHTADYWPYGEVRTETGTKKSPFGYVGVLGYMKDFADALYVRLRYLRTKLARWQTVDPLWPTEESYSYTFNSPLSVADPSGMAPGGQGCTGNNFILCQAKCASRGGVRRCVQKWTTKTLLECSCKNPVVSKRQLRNKLWKLLRQLNVWSWICSAPCAGGMLDCVVDLFQYSSNLVEAACNCYEGYRIAKGQITGVQSVAFDLSCTKVLALLWLICDRQIDVFAVK